jgi:hypothetical protein
MSRAVMQQALKALESGWGRKAHLLDRFGRLVLIEKIEPSIRKARYLCKCDCGKVVTKRIDDLKSRIKSGLTPSCGCWFHEERVRISMRLFDPSSYMGKRSGRLVVTGVDVDESRKKGKSRLVCMCDCGAQTVVRPDCFNYGTTKSCGCIQKEHASEMGMLELRHGKTVFGPLRDGMTPIYQIWASIRKGVKIGLTMRTYNTVLHEYDPRWDSFEAFYDDFGDIDVLQTVKRIDNQLPWCKENCIVTRGLREIEVENEPTSC